MAAVSDDGGSLCAWSSLVNIQAQRRQCGIAGYDGSPAGWIVPDVEVLRAIGILALDWDTA